MATATAATPAVSRRVVAAEGAPARRLSLSDVQQGSKKLPSRVVFHGQAGQGKTTWASYATSPVFLLSPGETGLHTLIDSGVIAKCPNVEIESFDMLMGFVGTLTAEEHSYKTLVIDTIDGMEKEANKKHCVEAYKGDWSEKGFMGYQRGYRSTAAGPWRELLAVLDKLRETKRMGIILLAHTGVVNQRNPLGLDFHRYQPSMSKETWELTMSWADMVLYGERVIVSEKKHDDRAVKGYGGDTRVMHTEWNAAFDAKNRHNLPPTIDMGNSGKEAWDNFIKAIKEGREKAAAQNGGTTNG